MPLLHRWTFPACVTVCIHSFAGSPLENHHLAAAFKILRQQNFNFLSSLPKSEFERFRKVVIELVLATDMKQHFSILSHFTTVHR